MNKDNDKERKEAEALMKRLEAQFGDVDLDLELLGLGDEEQVALELEEVEEAERTQASAIEPNHGSQSQADAEAAALMARLGAQFGDLDMSLLGLGGGDDEESSDPTPEELKAWQAAQFVKGKSKQKEADQQRIGGGGTSDSTQLRRKFLRDQRDKQLTQKQVDLRLQTGLDSGVDSKPDHGDSETSVLDLLGGDSSTFFGPSTTSILEQLVSDETHGDPEILRTSWKRLYASYEQGLGFWNLWTALKGYDGPTLLVLRCIPSASKAVQSLQPTKTVCLGFYTTTPWMESTGFFGRDISCEDGDKAFLFSIDETAYPTSNNDDNKDKDKPSVRFFPVQSKSIMGGYMYCQPSARSTNGRSTGKSVAATGLGVGGRSTQPRFHLTETFEDCSCLTYDSGRATLDGDLFACFEDDNTKNEKGTETSEINDNNKSPSPPDKGHAFARALYCFDVTDLEAWGVGGKDWINHALKERERAREQHIRRYQKVDKKMMWDQGGFGSKSNKAPGNAASERNR